MADIVADITVQSISAFIGGGAVAVVPSIVQLFRRRRAGARIAPAEASGSADRGASAIVVGGDLEGDVGVSIDNSRSIVIHNMKESSPEGVPAADTSTNGTEWLAVAVMVVAAGLFASYYMVLSWFTLGAALGGLFTAISGGIRAWRIRLWDRGSTIIVIDVILTAVAVVWTWVAIFTSEHRGTTLEGLRTRIADEAALAPTQSGPVGWFISFVVSPLAAFIKIGVAENQLLFIVSLFGAFLLSLALLLLTWSRLYDWYSYVGFLYGTGNERAVSRAVRHLDLRATDSVVVAILATIVIMFASGVFVWLSSGSAPSLVPSGAAAL